MLPVMPLLASLASRARTCSHFRHVLTVAVASLERTPTFGPHPESDSVYSNHATSQYLNYQNTRQFSSPPTPLQRITSMKAPPSTAGELQPSANQQPAAQQEVGSSPDAQMGTKPTAPQGAGAGAIQQPAAPVPDPFLQPLQSKMEQQLIQLMEQARRSKLEPSSDTDLQDDEEPQEHVNPETGEVAGPKGKEPTRFGDWEIRGRCSDF